MKSDASATTAFDFEDLVAARKREIENLLLRRRALEDQRQAIAPEMTRLHNAPPGRGDLEAVLTQAVEAYASAKLPELENALAGFRHNHRAGPDTVQALASALITRPDLSQWFLAPVLLPAMIEGAKRLAAEMPWPDGIESDDRAVQAATVAAKLEPIKSELATIKARLAMLGAE